MKQYDVIELEIDWEDRSSAVSQMIPKAPAVPFEVRRSGSGAPNVGPDPDEGALDEEWEQSAEADGGELGDRVEPGTMPGIGKPPEAS